jgi:hypothetical protein
MPAQKQEQFQEMRCSSAGRGSMYDSVVGEWVEVCDVHAGRATVPGALWDEQLQATRIHIWPAASSAECSHPDFAACCPLPPTASFHRAGITCHFCRQKKLCGEDDCPRCSRRSVNAECIGKSDCSRCHSALGRFCRACLLIRYGMTLEVGVGG